MKKIALNKLIFLFIIFIVLGQLPGFFLDRIFTLPFTIHPLDFFLVVFAFLGLKKIRKPIPLWIKAGLSFLVIGLFSLILYSIVNNELVIFRSLFYLLRYFAFLFSIYFFFKEREDKNLLNLVGLAGIGVAILGWMQYFLSPDIRVLKIYGWDDHLFRLVGSYLDPAFTGIILVLVLLIFVNQYFKTKSKIYIVAITFLALTVLFTYSRSSYLALFSGLFTFVLSTKYKKILIIILFLVLIPFLPRPSSEGVKLERLHSIYLKIENSKYGLSIVNENPLFGIGLNNVCNVKVENFKDSFVSNSCSGLDNSILFILVTTGVVGLVLFADFILHIYRSTSQRYRALILSIGAALSVHTMFTNTIFYVGVLSLLSIVLGATRKNS